MNLFGQEDNIYNDIRERSLMQWLDEMEQHEDVVVRGGVKLAKEYFAHLKQEVTELENKNKLKDEYLRKMKMTQIMLKSKQE